MAAAADGCSWAKASVSSSDATEYMPMRVASGAKIPEGRGV
jgi:hypothetical protein